MPPSQLKRLKASLREQGITGPQLSKKEKKRNKTSGRDNDKRIQRNAALEGIREQFNPFEVKATTKTKKFGTANDSIVGKSTKGMVARPGVTKGQGEETRRKTLLLEMQRRNKVGGINDRRFGENDPFMTPEEKMMERFTREQQSRHKRGSMFDLEDDEEEGQLTHFGKSLAFDDAPMDDFEEGDLGVSDESDGEERRGRKRRRPSDVDGEEEASEGEEGEAEPERKKTKAEVMKEVIAKSKLHKYERQKNKEDDDELREELDEGLPALLALLHGHPAAKPSAAPPPQAPQDPNAHINPERAALMNGTAKPSVDKEYDERLRQMAFDKRSKPTERTKTEEEKAEEDAKRLRELEEKRLRRMRGEEDSEDEAPMQDEHEPEGDEDDLLNDAADFGFESAEMPTYTSRRPPVDVEDEDDFVIDDDLVASGSDLDLDAIEEGSEDESDAESEDNENADNDDDEEFIGGLLSKEEMAKPEFSITLQPSTDGQASKSNGDLAFTFSCPQTHEEMLEVTKNVALFDLPTAVQRIRALHNPKLAAENKAKLGAFATVLVEHIVYLANQPSHPPFSVLETLVRHVHSLARTYPDEIGRAFRHQLKSFQETRPSAPTAGDLIVLTAIGCIFPTSDHFHQVVTPASLSMARYLGQKIPQTLHDLATGAYLATLCLQYQRLSKRYYPEFINFVLNALYLLAPVKPDSLLSNIPYHEPTTASSLRLNPQKLSSSGAIKPMHFWDTVTPSTPLKKDAAESLKSTLITTFTSLLDSAADLWTGSPAFFEIFEPALHTTQFLLKSLTPRTRQSPSSSSEYSTLQKPLRKTTAKLQRVLQHARLARRPLELHHHRPLPIKSAIPKFEETFNPDKHYDPDRERAELSKLRAEHKRERKGALRELRKDASFIARENLRQKKEADRAYEQKYKRLVAEIQGEEGREKNAYEREKRMRKGRS